MKTIEEIKEIIARKVAGQGNQIDLGGGVNEALNAICEVLGNVPKTRVLKVLGAIEHASLSEVLQKLELDGKTPTFDDMAALNPEKDNIVISYPTYTGNDKYTITIFEATDKLVVIGASIFVITTGAIESATNIYIELNHERESSISISEL